MLQLRVSPPSPSSPRLDVEVTNRHLMGILTKDSLALLIQLAAQVGVRGGVGGEGRGVRRGE